VHGLGAHSTFTWTQKASGEEIQRLVKDDPTIAPDSRVNWLSDFLPRDFLSARIMSFGYNANWFFMAPTKTPQESARDLLRVLSEHRAREKV
jgi:hypothetical protein